MSSPVQKLVNVNKQFYDGSVCVLFIYSLYLCFLVLSYETKEKSNVFYISEIHFDNDIKIFSSRHSWKAVDSRTGFYFWSQWLTIGVRQRANLGQLMYIDTPIFDILKLETNKQCLLNMKTNKSCISFTDTVGQLTLCDGA